MRSTLLALLLACAATAAVAQPAPPPPQDQPGTAPQGQGSEGGRERMRDGMGPMRYGMGGGYMGGGQVGGMRYQPGARFMFDKDNAHVDIRCGTEPVRACADAAISLLDKLGTMPTR